MPVLLLMAALGCGGEDEVPVAVIRDARGDDRDKERDGEDSKDGGTAPNAAEPGEREPSGDVDVFDPLAMYVEYGNVFSLLGEPLTAYGRLNHTAGESRKAIVRPGDGHLVYYGRGADFRRSFLEFRCDEPCPVNSIRRVPTRDNREDPGLESVCPDPTDFSYSPDGTLYVRCPDGWTDPNGRLVTDTFGDLTFHDEGIFLKVSGGSSGTFELRTLAGDVPWLAVPYSGGFVHDVRAVEDGFLVLVGGSDDRAHLHHLGFDGRYNKLGSFPEAADRFGMLDGQGRLITRADGYIARWSLDEDKVEKLHRDTDDPVVLPSRSVHFITGPGGGRFSPDPDAPTASDGVPDFRTAKETFDPARVYLTGRTAGGPCGLVDPEEPTVVTIGFDCNVAERFQIRRQDGRLLYWHTTEETFFEMHCDGWCQYIPGDSKVDSFTLTASDLEVVDAPECPNRVARLIETVSGDYFHTCEGSDDTDLFDAAGQKVSYVERSEQVWVGKSGVMMSIDGLGAVALTNLETGTRTSINGALGVAVVGRALDDDSFLVAHRTAPSEAPLELSRLTTNGTVTKLGRFPPMPEGHDLRRGTVLDGFGRLWRVGNQGLGTDRDLSLILSEIGAAESQVVMAETDWPWPSVNSLDGELVTGTGGPGPK